MRHAGQLPMHFTGTRPHKEERSWYEWLPVWTAVGFFAFLVGMVAELMH